MIVFMSLFRLNLYFLSVFHAIPDADGIEVLHSFLAGIRFDILIFGFALIPITVLLFIQAVAEKWPKAMFGFYKSYMAFVWTAICLLTYVDFFYFVKQGARMRWEQYRSWTFQTWIEQTQEVLPNQLVIYSIITVLLLALGLMMVKSLKFGEWKDEFSPRKGGKIEIVIRILLPFILVFLAARGTVEPHHLALEHSEVSSKPSINEMALNAVWCFDK